MISERLMVETGDTMPSRRFGSAVRGHLKALSKSETTKGQNYAKAEIVHLRMIDLNLFRVFDAMMLHRSVRKASQMLSVTPSAVSHALSRLRQSIGDELFIPGESGMQPTRRALELATAVREGLDTWRASGGRTRSRFPTSPRIQPISKCSRPGCAAISLRSYSARTGN